MALSKISLTLGKGKTKQKIQLTPAQFEELKQDMRDLDKSHNYYWHHSPWYGHWYNGGIRTFSTSNATDTYTNAVSAVNFTSENAQNALENQPEPPSFSGKILSAV